VVCAAVDDDAAELGFKTSHNPRQPFYSFFDVLSGNGSESQPKIIFARGFQKMNLTGLNNHALEQRFLRQLLGIPMGWALNPDTGAAAGHSEGNGRTMILERFGEQRRSFLMSVHDFMI